MPNETPFLTKLALTTSLVTNVISLTSLAVCWFMWWHG